MARWRERSPDCTCSRLIDGGSRNAASDRLAIAKRPSPTRPTAMKPSRRLCPRLFDLRLVVSGCFIVYLLIENVLQQVAKSGPNARAWGS